MDMSQTDIRGSREGLLIMSLIAQDSTFEVILFCLRCGSPHKSELEAVNMEFRRITPTSRAGFVEKAINISSINVHVWAKQVRQTRQTLLGMCVRKLGLFCRCIKSFLCYSLQISFNLHLRPPG